MSLSKQNPRAFDDLDSALESCRRVSEAEYSVAHDALDAADVVAKDAEGRIARLLIHIREQSRHADGLQQTVEHIGEQITVQIEETLGKTHRALNRKRPRLCKFTLALFGRTMAGKSTFREAITDGDGATIGKGAQNTTRRTHEYPWKGLHIIDTPGIGAYKGERYRQQAVSVIDKSDVVLFLLREDGIQEDVFEGMKAVLRENKPVFFILNVMRNLEDDLNRRRFLANPDSLMGAHRLDGHRKRIHKLAVERLGMHEVRIFPIHAQAAFLAMRPEWEDHKDALYHASRMDDLHAALRHEVSVHGPVRRLQTLIDGTIGALQGLRDFYAAQSAKLGGEAAFFAKKLADFAHRSCAFQQDHRDRIVNGVAEVFAPVRTRVFDFIEENIERKDVGDRWTQRVKASGIDESLKRLQETAIGAAQELVEDFKREIQFDTEFGNTDSMGAPQGWDGWDLRRGFGRGAAVAGVLSAAALLAVELGAPNFWNPVGWVLLGVSVVAGFFAWLCRKKNDRLSKAKKEAREQLKRQIDEREAQVREKLLEWFQGEIVAKTVARVSTDLAILQENLHEVTKMLTKAERATAKEIDQLNRHLLMKAAGLHGMGVEATDLIAMARERGSVTRALCIPAMDHERMSKIVSAALSEDVLVIPDGPEVEVVRKSLRPAKVLSVKAEGRKFVVRMPPAEQEKLRGTGERVLRITERLVQKTIKLTSSSL